MKTTKPQEWMLIEPGDSDIAEGDFSTKAFCKDRFAIGVWERRVEQSKTPENGMTRVISYDIHQEALEDERMKLVACGVAALQNTESSVLERMSKHSPYYSASYGYVCQVVDREMKLREQVAKLKQALQFYADCPLDSGMIEGVINGGEYVPLGETARTVLRGLEGSESK